MKNIQLYRFIKNYVEDEYAMNVFYNIVKDSFVKNDFSLDGISSFYLDGRYLGEAYNVTSMARYKEAKHVLALLLSLRLIIIDSGFFKFCDDDRLLILSRPPESFQWIEYMTVIRKYWNDSEIKMLYTMLDSYYYNEDFTEEEKQKFEASIAIPEYRNERNYYKNLAESTVGVANNVIGNNAFVEATIEKYVVASDIEYVGDTAFAFCDNLKTLEFEGRVIFGAFPIVECKKLNRIIVPEEDVDYYKTELPYYKTIITIGGETEDVEVVEVDENATGKEEEPLPEEKREIDYSSLATIFDKKASSYKYFWFVSLISLAKETGSPVISYREILIRMASLAWPIVIDNEIDLGNTDQMAKYLSEVAKKTSLIKAASHNVVERHLTMHYDSQNIGRILAPLLKNVPYRFLTPWVTYTTDKDVIETSKSPSFTGLYALHKSVVVVNKEWWNYIEPRYAEILDFAKKSFVEYVKKYNDQIKLLKFMTNGWGIKNNQACQWNS